MAERLGSAPCLCGSVVTWLGRFPEFPSVFTTEAQSHRDWLVEKQPLHRTWAHAQAYVRTCSPKAIVETAAINHGVHRMHGVKASCSLGILFASIRVHVRPVATLETRLKFQGLGGCRGFAECTDRNVCATCGARAAYFRVQARRVLSRKSSRAAVSLKLTRSRPAECSRCLTVSTKARAPAAASGVTRISRA